MLFTYYGMILKLKDHPKSEKRQLTLKLVVEHYWNIYFSHFTRAFMKVFQIFHKCLRKVFKLNFNGNPFCNAKQLKLLLRAFEKMIYVALPEISQRV